MNTLIIPIKSLDLSFQTRYGLMDETVAEYAELMSDGVEFPPVSVYDISGVLSLVDGYHRVAAATQLKRDTIAAVVTPGTRADALRASVIANGKHGHRRTNADKHRALEIAWENRDILFDKFLGKDDKGNDNGLPSSRQLAAITGVSQRTCSDFITNSGVSNLLTPSRKKDATTVTKKHLEERNANVRALLKDKKDRFGVAIPEKILPAFLSTDPKEVNRQLNSVRKFVESRIFAGDIAFAALGQSFLVKFDALIGDLKYWTPYCVCRACRGLGCNCCSDRGFQTRSQYDRTPSELKAENGGAK